MGGKGRKRAGWKGSGKVRRKVERKRIRWEGKVGREGGKGGRKGCPPSWALLGEIQARIGRGMKPKLNY